VGRQGLVIWYEVDGDRFIAFPKFHENQKGLHVDREAESEVPEPPPELLRTFAGESPTVAEKVRQWNGM